MLAYSILYIAAGILLGLFVEKILLRIFFRYALKTKWKGDEVIINAFHWVVLSWGVLAGFYIARHYWSLSERQIHILDQAVLSVFIFTLALVAAKLAAGFIRLKNANNSPGTFRSTSIMANVIKIAIYLVGSLIILQVLGIPITPLLTALGVGGLAVALALQDTLSNLFAGIQVIASRQVRTGDYIKLESGEEGYITDITWRNTTIRMLSNNLVVVPNAKISSAILINYYLPDKEMSVLMEVGVSYESDLDKVEKVTIQAASEALQKVDTKLNNFEPFIRYHTFSDSSIGFTVIMRVMEFTDQYLVKHEFIKILQQKYKEQEIHIPFPSRTVYLKKTDHDG